jgi:hypothetical protein
VLHVVGLGETALVVDVCAEKRTSSQIPWSIAERNARRWRSPGEREPQRRPPKTLTLG